MFIIGYLIILVIRANHVVVPHLVSTVFGIGAIVEGSIYLISLLATIFIFVKAFKD